MTKKVEERAPFTLGTSDDLGFSGMLIEVFGAVLKGYATLDKHRCTLCRRRFRVVIRDGSGWGRSRVLERPVEWQKCDDCHAGPERGPQP